MIPQFRAQHAELILPSKECLPLIYLRRPPTLGALNVLQSRRTRKLVLPQLEEQYAAQQPKFANALAEGVRSAMSAAPLPAAIVTPPSARSDASPYLEEILKRIALPNLSKGFSRKKLVWAAHESSFQENDRGIFVRASGLGI
jgi:hypothetical protein